MRGNKGRIVIFFVVAFAAVTLPIALMGAAALVSPLPYVLTGKPVAPEWFAGMSRADGTHAVVMRLRDPGQAIRWAKYRLKTIDPFYRSADFSGMAWYRDKDDAHAGLIMPVANLVVEITGPGTATVASAVKSLDFVRENTRKGFAWVLENHLGILLVAILAYLVALIPLMARLGSWAATIRANRSVTPVAEAELRRRLNAIDEEDVPFTIVPGKDERLKVEWRLADARWTHLVSKLHVRRIERLTLGLDDRSNTVRVVESTFSVRGSAGLFGFLAHFSGFTGIRFGGMETASEYGLTYSVSRGWQLDKAYGYHFSVNELKAPLAAAVTESGWTWKPVVTLAWPIGG